MYFDARGGYKETKDNLRERLKEIAEQIKVDSSIRYDEFKEATTNAQLKAIKDENVYIIEIKKLIAFGEDILKDISQSEIEGLI